MTDETVVILLARALLDAATACSVQMQGGSGAPGVTGRGGFRAATRGMFAHN